MNQPFIIFFCIVALCSAELSFLKAFTVNINDYLRLSYDGENERVIISEANRTSVYFCGQDGFIEFYVKDKQESGCKHGLLYACGLMDYYVKQWVPIRPLLENISNNAKFIENTTCSYNGGAILCSYWRQDLLSCQSDSYVLWNVLHLGKDNYFPLFYFKTTTRTENDCDVELYFYNLVSSTGPTYEDINNWVMNNC